MTKGLRTLLRKLLVVTLGVTLFVAVAGVGTLGYFHYAPPSKTCLTCHEMTPAHAAWSASAHAGVDCRTCHGGSLTTDVHAIKAHVRRVVGHFNDPKPEEIRLTHQQAQAVSERCASCHATEAAKWRAGGHSATLSHILLNEKQNKREQLNGDCLRCHGMLADGSTGDLVTPIDTKGPWSLKQPEMATAPATPCLACHAVHAPRGLTTGVYSRHEKRLIPATNLPAPQMRDPMPAAVASAPSRPVDGSALLTSADPRQRMCVQCHAPEASHLAGTADDRTPRGVHAGISCAACHDPRSARANSAAQACATCHPAASHCGLDVATMDTTFKSPKSGLDVHAITCADCHNGTRPAGHTPAP